MLFYWQKLCLLVILKLYPQGFDWKFLCELKKRAPGTFLEDKRNGGEVVVSQILILKELQLVHFGKVFSMTIPFFLKFFKYFWSQKGRSIRWKRCFMIKYYSTSDVFSLLISIDKWGCDLTLNHWFHFWASPADTISYQSILFCSIKKEYLSLTSFDKLLHEVSKVQLAVFPFLKYEFKIIEKDANAVFGLAFFQVLQSMLNSLASRSKYSGNKHKGKGWTWIASSYFLLISSTSCFFEALICSIPRLNASSFFCRLSRSLLNLFGYLENVFLTLFKFI